MYLLGLETRAQPQLLQCRPRDSNLNSWFVLTDVVDSFHPFTAAQQMLVQDLVMLRWEKRRNERAQAAAISYELETLDIDNEELRKQRDRVLQLFNSRVRRGLRD